MLVLADKNLADSCEDVPEDKRFRHVSEHPKNLCTPFFVEIRK